MSIYEDAAILIANGRTRHACSAILISRDYCPEHSSDSLMLFKEFFMQRGSLPASSWWGDPSKDNQMARSLALLLMHEMTKG